RTRGYRRPAHPSRGSYANLAYPWARSRFLGPSIPTPRIPPMQTFHFLLCLLGSTFHFRHISLDRQKKVPAFLAPSGVFRRSIIQLLARSNSKSCCSFARSSQRFVYVQLVTRQK